MTMILDIMTTWSIRVAMTIRITGTTTIARTTMAPEAIMPTRITCTIRLLKLL